MDQIQMMRIAYEIATNSPDPSTQNGAVLWGRDAMYPIGDINDFPAGVGPRLERPEKYSYIEHAERAVIYQAALGGYKTWDSTMYCTWAACADCARAIVSAGVRTLVRHRPPNDGAADRWAESVATGDIILTEGGVDIVEMEHYFGPDELGTILRDGQPFQP